MLRPMHKITRVGVLSLGKVMGAAGVGLGLVIGVLYGFGLGIAGVIGVANDEEDMAVLLPIAAGVCIGAPIAYGVFMFLMGLVYAVILNFVFRFAGGLELEITPPDADDKFGAGAENPAALS